MKEEKGKVITICGSKGGTGKSILTCFLAVALSSSKKVLLIDMDVYTGSLAFLFGKEGDQDISTLMEDFQNHTVKPLSKYTRKISQSLDLLASCKDPRKIHKMNPQYISSLLSYCKESYDYILIDTNHSLDDLNIFTFDVSWKLLLVFTSEATSIKNTKSFLTILEEAEKENVELLWNQVCSRESYFKQSEIEEILNRKIDYLFPNSFFIKNLDDHVMQDTFLKSIGQVLKKNASFLLADHIEKEDR